MLDITLHMSLDHSDFFLLKFDVGGDVSYEVQAYRIINNGTIEIAYGRSFRNYENAMSDYFTIFNLVLKHMI